jgi:hypothetical protein
MIRRIVLNKIGILWVFKIKGDVFKKFGLVILDREVIMGVPLSHQVVGDISLCQEGICGDFFSLNIDRVK